MATIHARPFSRRARAHHVQLDANRADHSDLRKLRVLAIRWVKQVPKRSGKYLFEVILHHYEMKPTIMTSNQPLENWGKLIVDVPVATTILDRSRHHAEAITITGCSYRSNAIAGKYDPENGSARKPGSGGSGGGEPSCGKPTE